MSQKAFEEQWLESLNGGLDYARSSWDEYDKEKSLGNFAKGVGGQMLGMLDVTVNAITLGGVHTIHEKFESLKENDDIDTESLVDSIAISDDEPLPISEDVAEEPKLFGKEGECFYKPVDSEYDITVE